MCMIYVHERMWLYVHTYIHTYIQMCSNLIIISVMSYFWKYSNNTIQSRQHSTSYYILSIQINIFEAQRHKLQQFIFIPKCDIYTPINVCILYINIYIYS